MTDEFDRNTLTANKTPKLLPVDILCLNYLLSKIWRCQTSNQQLCCILYEYYGKCVQALHVLILVLHPTSGLVPRPPPSFSCSLLNYCTRKVGARPGNETTPQVQRAFHLVIRPCTIANKPNPKTQITIAS